MTGERLVPLVALLGSIALGVAGQLPFKSGVNKGGGLAGIISWTIAGGLAAYGVSMLLYLIALRRLPLSVAVPSLALGHAVSAAPAVWLLGERLHAVQRLGIVPTPVGVAPFHVRADA